MTQPTETGEAAPEARARRLVSPPRRRPAKPFASFDGRADGKPAALVTGCSSGIGRATALALAAAGHPTWATARDPETLAELSAAGCRTLALDVTDHQARHNAVQAVVAEHGAVGVLVNAAGYAQAGPAEQVPLPQVREQLETNVLGPLALCQEVLPGMRAAKVGRIIMIGSASGLVGLPATFAYGMSKWAIEALSDALRIEVKQFGVAVTVIEPGAVAGTRFAATEIGTWPSTPVEDPYEAMRRSHDGLLIQWTSAQARGVLRSEDVARVVLRAVQADRPRARYKVGLAPRVMPALYRMLPARLYDGLWQHYLRIQ